MGFTDVLWPVSCLLVSRQSSFYYFPIATNKLMDSDLKSNIRSMSLRWVVLIIINSKYIHCNLSFRLHSCQVQLHSAHIDKLYILLLSVQQHTHENSTYFKCIRLNSNFDDIIYVLHHTIKAISRIRE